MNFIKRWILGKVVREMGDWLKQKLGKNRTTTVLGVLAYVYLATTTVIAVLDDDPNTNPDFGEIQAVLLGGGTVAILTREQGQHDKENGK